jgi:hypothetical protein
MIVFNMFTNWCACELLIVYVTYTYFHKIWITTWISKDMTTKAAYSKYFPGWCEKHTIWGKKKKGKEKIILGWLAD